ncbi:hypothetical protein I7I50_04987 [Histoplasma capsulatum G186AR]|uniref:Uncharacterized protein n=1 Tax=Ajellomyces capsulatus TaxID=5037 RepID=A0A8H7ZBM2_AJECA|nr:hypothetical protein I7I52_03245 [Histoplasma capsulatum]QSS75744.1 hypothetical protein I7I50_04987 [Histoplasma capsulatum G186AR]
MPISSVWEASRFYSVPFLIFLNSIFFFNFFCLGRVQNERRKMGEEKEREGDAARVFRRNGENKIFNCRCMQYYWRSGTLGRDPAEDNSNNDRK